MTKKEFVEHTSYHKYTARPSDNNVNALFFDWQSNDEGVGFKYCVYARACMATKKDLIDCLYNYFRGLILETPYYIQLVVAPTDTHRFKVPLVASGLRSLIKYKTHSNGQRFI